MAVRGDWTPNEVLKADDLNDTFASKLDLAGGTVLQIVRATDSIVRSTTNTSFVDANISVTITPRKSNSAILLIWTAGIRTEATTNNANTIRLAITDSSNNEISGGQEMPHGLTPGITVSGTQIFEAPVVRIGYATPATTSATTYKGRFRSTIGITVKLENHTNTGQLFAIEVSA